MSRAKTPPTRISRNMTLSPVTEHGLEVLARLTGITRGKIVDLALANIGVCEACEGRGMIERDTVTCPDCRGARLVPGHV